jgi:hypothetical protein
MIDAVLSEKIGFLYNNKDTRPILNDSYDPYSDFQLGNHENLELLLDILKNGLKQVESELNSEVFFFFFFNLVSL